MKSLVRSLKQTLLGAQVPVIVINSAINAIATEGVRKSIQKIDPDRAKAIALLINSPGGSPVQCDIITNMVKSFVTQHKLPLYTFAEDVAASGGQFLLSIGDKSFAHETSLVGSVGVVGMKANAGKALRDHQVDFEIFCSNSSQLASFMNTLEDLTDEGRAKMMKNLLEHHKLFIEHVEKYSRIKLSPEERKEKIFNAQIILGEDAVRYGLVDEIGQFEKILQRDFPKAEMVLLGERKRNISQLKKILKSFPRSSSSIDGTSLTPNY